MSRISVGWNNTKQNDRGNDTADEQVMMMTRVLLYIRERPATRYRGKALLKHFFRTYREQQSNFSHGGFATLEVFREV